MVQLKFYENTEVFRAEILEVLLENESQNNLFISLITDSKARYANDWLSASVVGQNGITLTALYVKPFNLLLYEPGNVQNDDAVSLLAGELHKIGCSPPGVTAESDVAARFANAFCSGGANTGGTNTTRKYSKYMSIAVMQLDKPAVFEKAAGFCRELESRDMFFAPYWERAFSEDCRATVFSIPEITRRIKNRLGKSTHFFWEDGVPVSQAVHGRDTPNGSVINHVYTPPHYRGRGYAASVVALLSNSLLERGMKFCCLFADADNQASCGLYGKLGYREVCRFDDIRFDI